MHPQQVRRARIERAAAQTAEETETFWWNVRMAEMPWLMCALAAILAALLIIVFVLNHPGAH